MKVKEHVSKTLKHPLFSGSLVMLVGSNAVASLNYIYHFIMGRLLGPTGYGELVALISFIGLLSMLPAAFNLAIVRKTSIGSKEEVEGLVNWLNNKTIIASVIFFLMVLASTPFINSFLKISNPAIFVLVAVMFAFTFPNSFNRSVLQGLLRFKQLVFSNFIEIGTKLILGVILVFAGFSVGGAMIGLTMGAFLAWVFTRRFVADYTTKNEKTFTEVKSLFIYSIPVFIQSIALTSFYSTDIILVKHFFSAHDTGIYASVSTLGKIIFFATGPITLVMFPMVAQRHSKGEDFRKIFLFSFLATLLLGAFIVLIYATLPNLAVSILYGSSFLQASTILVPFSIFMVIFTLDSLLINFYLSLGKTKIVALPLIAAFLQAIGIWFYHFSILSVITVSIVVTSLLLTSLLLYFVYETQARFSYRSSLQAGENNS